MKLTNLIVITLCFIGWTGAAQQQSFSLDEALQYAVQNSNSIRLAQLETIGAEGQIQELRSTAIPKVSGALQYQHFPQLPQSLLPAQFFGGNEGEFIPVAFGLKNSLSTDLNANAVLFDPTVFVGIKSAEMYRELLTKQLDQTKYELKYNVTQAYLGALIPVKNKEVLDRNIANLEKTLRETSAFFEEGFVEKLDVERLVFSLENLRTQAQSLSQLVELSQNILKFQMGYPIDEPITLTDNIDLLINSTLVNDKELVEANFSVESRPEYDVIKAGEQLNRMDIKAKESVRYPSAYAFANHNRTLQRNDLFDSNQPDWIKSTVIGATINVPIFNGMTTKHQVQQAEVELRKTQIQLNDFARAAQLEYQNSKIAYNNAKRTVQSNERSVKLAEKIFDTTQIKYREGVGSSLELIQAEADLYQAQSNHINSLYDLLVAKADLEKALGEM